MIVLEALPNDHGGPASRNFEALARLVLDTGGVSAAVRFGASTMTWTASTDSGPKTITHGLGVTPTVIFVTNGDTAGSYPGIAAYTTLAANATTFDVYGRAAGAIAGTKVIYWLAIG